MINSFMNFLKQPIDNQFVLILENKIRDMIKQENILKSPTTPTGFIVPPLECQFNGESDEKRVYNLQNLEDQISLNHFIKTLILKSKVRPSTLFGTMVYLNRFKQNLPVDASGFECSYYRIFLAALSLSGKYLNDSSPKNKHWTLYSKIFNLNQVNTMEFQFLDIIGFDLSIKGSELLHEYSAFHNAKSYNGILSSVPSLSNNNTNTNSVITPLSGKFPKTPMSGMFPTSLANYSISQNNNHRAIYENNYAPKLQPIGPVKRNSVNSSSTKTECTSTLYRRRKNNKIPMRPLRIIESNSKTLPHIPPASAPYYTRSHSSNNINKECITNNSSSEPKWSDIKLPPITEKKVVDSQL